MMVTRGCSILIAAAAAVGTFASAAPCDEVALAALHIFDVSRSHENDVGRLISDILTFEASLEARFFARISGLASFSDKPEAPFGDRRGDYCYREDRVFGEDTISGVAQGLKIRSGRDWKESQLEAAWKGIVSNTLQWPGPNYQGQPVQRVIIVHTDALPHVQGDFVPCPPRSTVCARSDDPCLQADYPSVNQVQSAAEAWSTHVLFVVTSDVYRPWVRLLSDRSRLHVIERIEMNDDLIDKIAEVSCDSPVVTTPVASTTAPVVGCGAAYAMVNSATMADCDDLCNEYSLTCEPDRTLAVHTQAADCVAAAEEAFSPAPITYVGQATSASLAGGCNVENGREALINPTSSGCGAAAATTADAAVARVCCCE